MTFDGAAYGEAIADIYDSTVDGYDYLDTETEADVLVDLAGGGRLLELGVGTGRVAVPVAQRGSEIVGIDISPAMLRQLRARPGGDRVTAVVGDMADVAVAGSFSLVFSVFQTFFCIPTQDEQVRCFANVADVLEPDGRFLIEGFVPPLGDFDDGRRLRLAGLGPSSVNLTFSTLDPMAQRITSQLLFIGEQDFRLVPWTIRYAWPSELDLMARLAGLELEQRWQDWQRTPVGSAAARHISIYRRATR
jgi:SAM-dependent methyltransferase